MARPPDTTDAPPPGAGAGSSRGEVSGYRLISRIGEGGMGIVYLARRGEETEVALKVLRPHIVGDEEGRRRLAREVSSLQRIHSPWVAEIVDADPWAPIPYVATRYVAGPSLYDQVVKHGAVLGDDLLWLAAGLIQGLASVHEAGVLHRDVKPSNVLMEGRTPILIDFGLARVADDPRLTHTGWLLGTPGYLAPEILHGEDATVASDLHAWAATVAYAGLGKPPFGRGPSMAVMDRVRRGQVKLDGLGGRDGDAPLKQLVAACLEPDPARRPVMADAVAWLADRVPDLAPPPRRERTASRTDPTSAEGHDPFDDALALFEPPPEEDLFADTLALFEPAEDPGEGKNAVEPATAVVTEQIDPPTRRYTEYVHPTVVEPAAPPPPRAEPAPPAPPVPPQRVYHDPPLPLPFEVARASEPRPPLAVRARRIGLGSVLTVLGGVTLAAAPWLTMIGWSILLWVLRSGSLAGSAVAQRRTTRGHRWYDPITLVVASPWHAVQAIPGAALLWVWAAGLAVSGGLICYAVAASTEVTLLVCGAIFTVSAWWGPGGSRLRGPISRLTHPLCDGVGPWLIALIVAIGLVIIGLLVLSAHGPWWLPMGAPSLPA